MEVRVVLCRVVWFLGCLVVLLIENFWRGREGSTFICNRRREANSGPDGMQILGRGGRARLTSTTCEQPIFFSYTAWVRMTIMLGFTYLWRWWQVKAGCAYPRIDMITGESTSLEGEPLLPFLWLAALPPLEPLTVPKREGPRCSHSASSRV